MTPSLDLPDLWILYDAARGFVGLQQREEVYRYTLLSLIGMCGARFALALEVVGDGSLEPRVWRGLPDPAGASIRLTARARAFLDRAEGPLPRENWAPLGGRLIRQLERLGAVMAVPICARGRLAGLVILGERLFGETYTKREERLVHEIAGLAMLALAPQHVRPAEGRRESRSVRKKIQALRGRHPVLASFKGEGAKTAALFEEIASLADYDLPVLILGETGTGKELVGRALHDLSARRSGSFEAINCAAIPRDLMASALFGHEKGAFTGASSTVRGAFERAGEGTIFLDEIGDMPAETQASLLRVLQERSFRRVGGEKVLPARARVISATNQELFRSVEQGRFRTDLFYRLQMYTLRIPPLRERREEIPVLARHILETHRRARAALPAVAPSFLDALAARELRGNVRELEALLIGAMVRAGKGERLLPEHLPPEPVPSPGARPSGAGPQGAGAVTDIPTYEDMEREYILSVLKMTEGNKKEAAALMKIPRTTLNSRMAKLGIVTKE